ncbi:hypothetical protein KSP39_PZI023892 [Platanthera zijinensis]|uniref:Uncharacterized protein n=1 Tax=Platanthera zijinensis TaxID=2320716 RepID=A0AAP0ATB4_9ASPA
MYGGWDGKKWLSDVYILDTMSLEWTELSITGSAPPQRCGHTTTMVEKRLLVFGGRGGGGPIMGDLWALKGLIEEENEMPGWTQLKLPGQPPSPRCGHTVTSGGHYLLVFGGHGTGGWLSRYDIYHNDCIVLDRISVQWKRLVTYNEPPSPRAYHSMTCIGERYILFGGFDGKTTFGDIWWLVPEDDPISKRSLPSPPNISSESEPVISSQSAQSAVQGNLQDQSVLLELQKKLGFSIPSSDAQVDIVDEMHDKELLELSTRLLGEMLPTSDQAISIQALREHWKTCAPNSIQLRELGALLRDYQRLILSQCSGTLLSNSLAGSSNHTLEIHHFFHVKNASQREIPRLCPFATCDCFFLLSGDWANVERLLSGERSASPIRRRILASPAPTASARWPPSSPVVKLSCSVSPEHCIGPSFFLLSSGDSEVLLPSKSTRPSSDTTGRFIFLLFGLPHSCG